MALTTISGNTLTTISGNPIVSVGNVPAVSSGFELAEAKARLSIPPTDTTKDVQIQSALDAALGIIENYLDRKLLYSVDVEHLFDTAAHTIQLRRYPIDDITSINTLALVNVHVDKEQGTIHFNGDHVQHVIDVSYKGGYKILPDDLLIGMWMVFDEVYATMTSAGGASVAGEISRITVPDVGSIQYTTSKDAAASGGSSPLTAAAYLFDAYRRHMV